MTRHLSEVTALKLRLSVLERMNAKAAPVVEANRGDSDNKVAKTYKISATPEVLDRFEQFLEYVRWCSSVGHSCAVKFSIDGDGADRFDVVSPELPKVSEEDGRKMEAQGAPEQDLTAGGPGSGRKPSGFVQPEDQEKFHTGLKKWIDDDEKGLHKEGSHPSVEHVTGNTLGLHGFTLWRRSDSGDTAFYHHPEHGELALDSKNRNFSHTDHEGNQKGEGRLKDMPGYLSGLRKSKEEIANA